MVETKKKQIGDNEYTCTLFPAREALKLKTILLGILAPSLKGIEGNSLDADVNLGAVASGLMDKITEDNVVKLVLRLFACTRCNGKEIDDAFFDMHYAGNLKEMYLAIFFVLEANYSDFFGADGIGGILKRLEALRKSKTPSNISTSQ